MMNIFGAWDGMFTGSQIREIINMSLQADRYNVKLHDALRANAPDTKSLGNGDKTKKQMALKESVANLTKSCIENGCLGIMELFTVCCSDIEKKKQGFLTKWECNKCGKVEYSKQSLNDTRKLLLEGRNGTSE